MRKKWLFKTILGLTILIIFVIIALNIKPKYNKLIISSEKLNDIISKRNMSPNISLENIIFNDYNLIIDNERNTIYYSVVNSINKYNPFVHYKINSKLVKLNVVGQMTNEQLEKDSSLKILLYNDNSYRLYNLIITNYPLLNVNMAEKENSKNRVSVDAYLFDNHLRTNNHVIESTGILKTVIENKEYLLSLKKESLGHNKRENHISLFGMDIENEYRLTIANNYHTEGNSVRFFINNKYLGLFILEHNKERNIDNYERNKENNR